MPLVIIESPYAANTDEERDRNVAYARAAMRDCLMRSEAPFASHLLYTQPGVLDDDDDGERALGMEAGWSVGRLAKKTVVYMDLGVSPGMEAGMERARLLGRPVERRWLKAWATASDSEDLKSGGTP